MRMVDKHRYCASPILKTCKEIYITLFKLKAKTDILYPI